MAQIVSRTNKKGQTTYYFRVCVGRSTEGNKIIANSSWQAPLDMTPSKANKIANQKAMEFEKAVLNEEVSERIKFEDFSKKWIKLYAEKQLRKRTVSSDITMLERINKEIGFMYMDKIKPTTILGFYEKLEEPIIIKKYSQSIDLKKLIKERGLKIKDVATASNIAVNTIDRLSYGESVSEEIAIRICDTLGLNIKKAFNVQVEEKRLSTKTIRNHHALIRKIMETAVQWQVIPSNPCARVQPPRVRKKESYCMNEEEVNVLLSNLQILPLNMQAYFFIALDTGARRGELLGLTWDDINFEKQTIDINKAYLYLPSEGNYIDETKTESSNRIIKISSSSVQFLKMLKEEQEKQKIALGTAWIDSNSVFTNEVGKPINPDYVTNKFKSFAKKCELDERIHLHTLRHTSASLLVYSGVNLKAVSSRLGHASTQTTSLIYEHQIRKADEQASAVLEGFLGKPTILANV